MSSGRRRCERGGIMPLAVAAMLIMFAVLAFSVDQGIAYAAKARQENALDSARSACMGAASALVAKGSDDPGAALCDTAVRALRAQGFSGQVTVWFYEAPEESLPESERLWSIGLQVSEDVPTVIARGFGVATIPAASCRVVTAVPYASERVWRPDAVACGRFDVAEGATEARFTRIDGTDGFPDEVVSAARRALAGDRGQ